MLYAQEMNKVLRAISELSTAEFDFEEHLVVAGVVGSTAHNTYVEKQDPTTDDVDIQGIFIPPPDYLVGLKDMENWVQQADLTVDEKTSKYDWTFHSLRKYCQLLLKANPNVLCLLYLKPEHYIFCSNVFNELVKRRDWFASQVAYQSFAGYAYAQLQRMEHHSSNDKMGDKRKQLVTEFGYDVKNAAHAMRILFMGIEYVSTGNLTVWQPDDKAELLKSVKRGEWSLEKVKEYSTGLYDQLRECKEKSPLPSHPDYEGVNRLVTQLHLDFWKDNFYL